MYFVRLFFLTEEQDGRLRNVFPLRDTQDEFGHYASTQMGLDIWGYIDTASTQCVRLFTSCLCLRITDLPLASLIADAITSMLILWYMLKGWMRNGRIGFFIL